MNALKFFAAVAAAVLFHFLGVRMIPHFSQVIDVFLVVAVLYGLEGNSLGALFAGMFIGLVHDSLSGGPFGLFGFADTIIAYGAARLAQRLVIQRPTGVLAVVSFAAALQEAIVVGLMVMLLPDPQLPTPLGVALKAGLCGVLGMILYMAGSRWQQGADSRRRNRMSRLRFLG